MKTTLLRFWLTLLSLSIISMVALAADAIIDSRLMYVPFDSDNANSSTYKTHLFRILDQAGKDKGAGKALSDAAFEIAEWPTYGKGPNIQHYYYGHKVFPTGAEGQAVAFQAAEHWNTVQGSVVFWVKGQGWDVSTSLKEELFTVESPEGNVTFGKTDAKTLALTGPANQSVAFPIDFDPNRLHEFAITYDGKAVQIYVDGQPKVKEGTAFRMPAQVTRLVVGQLAPGGKTNKWIEDFSTYDRPLLLSEVNKLYITQGLITGRKLMAVTKTRKPIVIDGLIEPEEWGSAAQITGLLQCKTSLYDFWGPHDLAADQSTFWVTYDDQYLYVAHYSPPPAKIADQVQLVVAMLSSTRLTHDSDVDADDSIRISLLTPYPNGDEYKFYVNGAGTTYEFTSTNAAPGSKLSGINLSWDPQAKQRSTLTDKGWSIEVALPWKDFYVGTPQPGATLHMNFARLWRQVIQEDHAWCFGNRTFEDDTRVTLPGGEVVFQGEKGVVVQLQDVGKIRRGAVDVQANLLNATDAAQTLTVKVASNAGELMHEERVSLSPGEKKPYTFTGKIVDYRTHDVTFTVANAADDTLYYVTTLPVIRKDRPDVRVRKYRSIEQIKLETNIEFLGKFPLKDVTVKLVVVQKPSGKTFFKKSYAGLTSYSPAFTISTKDWPIGQYDIRYTFAAKGMKPYAYTTTYDRVPLPEWWNNTIGQELGVPYPWTPMKVDGENIHVWGRTYQFGNKLLPEQITTLNANMLRAPMRLVAKTAGGETLDTATAPAEDTWTKKTDLRVEGDRVVSGPGYKLRNQVWSEYDGLVWCRLTIEPQQKITLNSLEFEIPLNQVFTDVINTYDYSQRQTGKLTNEGFHNGIRPLWLGNGDGGIQWFCETDGWFFVKDTKNILHAEKRPEGATLRITMIDVPTDFEKPHTIEFGFIATPVRPKVFHTWQDPGTWGARGGPGPWYPQGEEFLPAPDYWGGTKSGWRGLSGEPPLTFYMQNIYITTGGINTKTDDFTHFGDEWLANDNTLPADIVLVTHASKSYRDWFVWRHWQSFQRNPHQSLYYDGAMENPSSNPYAGGGYVRRDGTVASVSPILGARDICRRLYNMIITYYPFAWVGFHQSGMPNMAYEGFGNWSWDGENFNSSINEKQSTYVGIMDPAKFRAEYMGHNLGWPVMFLGQARVRNEWADRYGVEQYWDHMDGLTLLHDAGPQCCLLRGGLPGERVEKLSERSQKAQAKHWLNTYAYHFLPYWRQDIVALDKPDMYASFYILNRDLMAKTKEWQFLKANYPNTIVPKKVIMIVYNDSNWTGEMRLKPDFKKMGFDAVDGIEVENAIHTTGFRVDKRQNDKGELVDHGVLFPRPEETARLVNGEVIFPMRAKNFRMIVFTQPQTK